MYIASGTHETTPHAPTLTAIAMTRAISDAAEARTAGRMTTNRYRMRSDQATAKCRSAWGGEACPIQQSACDEQDATEVLVVATLVTDFPESGR